MPTVLESPIITDPIRVHQGVAWSIELDLADDDGNPLPDGCEFTGWCKVEAGAAVPFDMEYADGVLTVGFTAEVTAVLAYGHYEWRITEPGQEPQVFGKGDVLFAATVFP